jgi:thiol-disulfide isomerase/thioredoxin
MIRSFALLAMAAVAAAAVAQPIAAQEPAAPAAPAAPVAPDAKALLGSSLRFLQALPALRLQGKGTMIMPELPEELAAQIDFGDMELPTGELDIQLALPNRFALRCEGMGMVDVVCDGKQLLQTIGQFELHSLTPAPKDLLTMLGAKSDLMPSGGSNLRALLAPAGSKRALLDAKTVELLGTTKLGERQAYHLAVRDEGIACELWIQQGDEPFVLRHKPVPPKLDMAAMMGGGEEDEAEGEDGESRTLHLEPAMDIEFTVVSKELGKDAFAITEPAGSTKVDDLQAAMMAKFEEQMGEMEDMDVEAGEAEAGEHGEAEAPHKSVGQPVPDVTLPLLGGGEVKLAELKGKVVLLDFWATWCGPCVQGLPKVNEVATKLAERGVVFYAVNLAEKPETIEKFLAKKELKLAVALADQKMGTKFGVNGIPHTVIVGKDGVVRTVHIGFGPGAEKQLEKDLIAAIEAGEQPKKDEPKKDEPKPAGGK